MNKYNLTIVLSCNDFNVKIMRVFLAMVATVMVSACDSATVSNNLAPNNDTVTTPAPVQNNEPPENIQSTGFPLTQGANIGVVAITGTDVNGSGRDQARVLPGEAFTVSFDFTIVASPGCPACIEQIQVGVVTRDGVGSPQACAYNGIAGLTGVTSSGAVTLIAPDAPGTYYIAFDRAQHFSCAQALSSGFWSGVDASKFIGSIAVY